MNTRNNHSAKFLQLLPLTRVREIKIKTKKHVMSCTHFSFNPPPSPKNCYEQIYSSLIKHKKLETCSAIRRRVKSGRNWYGVPNCVWCTNFVGGTVL